MSGPNLCTVAMMAYRSSIQSVTKYSPAYEVLVFPLSLPRDCIYSTPQNAIFSTSSDHENHETETTGNASVDARIYGCQTRTLEDLI